MEAASLVVRRGHWCPAVGLSGWRAPRFLSGRPDGCSLVATGLTVFAVSPRGPLPALAVTSRDGRGRLAGAVPVRRPFILAPMPTLIASPSVVKAAGNKPKIIHEFVGRVNSATTGVSIAQMQSPAGWIEPGQRPEFDEYTLVLGGMVRVTSETATIDVHPGQAVLARAGEWVQYSTPGSDGAEYVSVCIPAFSPQLVHRDE